MDKKSKTVWCLAALLVLAIVLPLTKPPRAKHVEWLKEHYLMAWDITPPGIHPPSESLEERLRRRFTYHDFGFCSTMTDNTWEGRVVSCGYLGYVSGWYPNR
jgi:hypothetical protein